MVLVVLALADFALAIAWEGIDNARRVMRIRLIDLRARMNTTRGAKGQTTTLLAVVLRAQLIENISVLAAAGKVLERSL